MAKKQLTAIQSLSYAMILHAVLIVMVVFSVSFAPMQKPNQALPFKQADKIVQAVSVNQTRVDNEIKKLKAEKAHKRAEEEARVARLKKEAAQAQATRKKQQSQFTKMKQAQLAAKKKAETELKKLNAEKVERKKQLASIEKKAKLTAEKQEKLKADITKLKKEQAKAKKQAAIDDLQKKIEAEQTQLDAQKKQAKVTSEIQKYKQLMQQAMQKSWVYPDNVNPSLRCIIEIKLAADGTVQHVKLVKSSGNQMLDQSAIAAVYKSSPLPMSSDPEVFKKMHDINLTASPIEQLS